MERQNGPIIIAEAGVNHNGSLQRAMELVDAAAAAGADYVKFQTFVAEQNVSRNAPKAQYQKEVTGEAESQLEMVKKLELKQEDFRQLRDQAEAQRIGFLSTPFDPPSIALLQDLGVKIGKIPSGELTNLPYLRRMARAFPRIVMSTGMCTLEDVANAIGVLEGQGIRRESLTLLHCNTQYPTPYEDVNLKAMETLRRTFDCAVGYSDHTLGIEVPVAAAALGATVIEKHFTLDKSLPGPDHQASLDPEELKAMVNCVRHAAAACSGDGIKEPSPSERANLAIVRKSIVAAVPIRAGQTFTEQNLGVKRPGTGINPMEWDTLIGQTARKDFDTDDLISL